MARRKTPSLEPVIQDTGKYARSIAGDFNGLFDKQGGNRIGSSNDVAFQGFMDTMGGIEVNFIGNLFTWNNDRSDSGVVRECWDRDVCNDALQLGFPKATILHIATNKSDHLALLLDSDYEREFLF